jgi:S-adenosylmethionine:tRNA ribosyltransferase-isomerase
VEYDLPDELIAQQAPAERDGGRLMVVRRGGAAPPEHSWVRDLPEWLAPGDVLVVNRSRVIRARVRGRRLPGGGAVELLLIAPCGDGANRWRALARPSKRLRDGQEIEVRPQGREDGGLVVRVRRRVAGEVEVDFPEGTDVARWLDVGGEPPLPPYIRRPHGPLPSDAERYQTVFAREPGSIAAPTAGLHLSRDLLARLSSRGVRVAEVVLHVGPATFLAGQPGRGALTVEPERYLVPAETRALLLDPARTGSVVAVGTTTTRALEAAARAGWPEGERETDLVLAPGASFGVVDALLTNFHLPGSSLLALVAAFAGEETVRRAYEAAVRARYRFYSYGDAMLLI